MGGVSARLSTAAHDTAKAALENRITTSLLSGKRGLGASWRPREHRSNRLAHPFGERFEQLRRQIDRELAGGEIEPGEVRQRPAVAASIRPMFRCAIMKPSAKALSRPAHRKTRRVTPNSVKNTAKASAVSPITTDGSLTSRADVPHDGCNEHEEDEDVDAVDLVAPPRHGREPNRKRMATATAAQPARMKNSLIPSASGDRESSSPSGRQTPAR